VLYLASNCPLGPASTPASPGQRLSEPRDDRLGLRQRMALPNTPLVQ